MQALWKYVRLIILISLLLLRHTKTWLARDKLVIHVAATMFSCALHYIVIFKTRVIIALDK